jgi:hypothetical protein
VGDAASPDPAAAGPATPSADRSADGRPNPRADVADRVERLDDSDQQHRAWHRQRATAILDVTNHINVEQQMQRLDNSIVILRNIESETGQTSSTRQTMLN